MIYAIVSDIHANESAFRQVLADARARGAETFVCLGDVVGYGPLPEETANLVRASCSVVLAGNHDAAVSGRLDPKDFIDLAGDAVRRHRKALSKSNLNWLRSLPPVYEGGDFLAAHGDLTDPRKFYYVQDEADAEVNFRARDFQLLFVGHTHAPGLFLTGDSGKVYRMGPTDFALEAGKRYIVNPGSVGYPRETNGSCQSSYVLYDSARHEVTFHFLPFSVSSVLQRGQSPKKAHRGLVAALALGLLTLIGAGAYRLTTKAVAVDDDARLVIRADSVQLKPEFNHFLPKLELDATSDPVLLKLTFKATGGKTVKTLSKIVRQTAAKTKFKVPDGAVTADIRLLKITPNDAPRILSYNPAFKP